MKKCFLLLTSLTFLLVAAGQDYIITWANDTIPCQLPENPKKSGLRPGWKYQNGYLNAVAVFANDSIRVIAAGDIKGYTRQVHGKSLLCDGFFESKKIVLPNDNKRTPVEEKKNSNGNRDWYFLNRVVQGKYASLYIYFSSQGSSSSYYYFISRQGDKGSNTVLPVVNKKRLIELLSDDEVAAGISDFNYRKSGKGFRDIVNEYNRLKGAAGQ